MKWQILYKIPRFSMLTQKKIVVATMVLHNFIREHASDDDDFSNFDRDPNFVPTIPERYNKWAVSQHASDADTDEPSFVTMDTFRDSMATSVAIAWNQCNKFYYYEHVIRNIWVRHIWLETFYFGSIIYLYSI